MKRLVLAALLLASCTDTLEDGADDGPDDGDGMETGGVQPTFSSLYDDYLANCADCHAPGAPGRTPGIEQSLDFSTRDSAYRSLQGMSAGLTGNFSDCNGVPFLSTTPTKSLLLASLHQPTRQGFSVGGCTGDSISDMTVKVGDAPSTEFLMALTTWLMAGSPNN